MYPYVLNVNACGFHTTEQSRLGRPVRHVRKHIPWAVLGSDIRGPGPSATCATCAECMPSCPQGHGRLWGWCAALCSRGDTLHVGELRALSLAAWLWVGLSHPVVCCSKFSLSARGVRLFSRVWVGWSMMRDRWPTCPGWSCEDSCHLRYWVFPLADERAGTGVWVLLHVFNVKVCGLNT